MRDAEEMKQPQHVADQSSASIGEVKNVWRIPFPLLFPPCGNVVLCTYNLSILFSTSKHLSTVSSLSVKYADISPCKAQQVSKVHSVK